MQTENITPSADGDLMRKAHEAYASANPKPRLFQGVFKYRSVEDASSDRDRRILAWYLAQQSATR